MKISKWFFIVIYTTFGCSTIKPQQITEDYIERTPIQSVLDKWIGTSELGIMSTYGAPNRSYEDNLGNRIMRYDGKIYEKTTGYYIGNTYYSNTDITQYYVEFIFNNKSSVINYRTNYPDLYVKKQRIRYENDNEIRKKKNDMIWAIPLLGLGILSLFL